MKIALQDNRRFVLRFDRGEEVIEALGQFMQEQKMSACAFNGIGACSMVELGYFNEYLKDYRKKPITENLEVISLIGNGTIMDSKPAIHAHGVFARTDFSILGGHVFKLKISVTCEVFLIKLDGTLGRQNNPEFNLNLLT